jgi:hypothetical protein
MQQINQEFTDLSRGFKALEVELGLHENCAVRGLSDRFADTLKTFIQQNQPVLKRLQAEKSDMEAVFKSVVEFFAEDPRTATPETFFSVFTKFLQDLDKARRDNVKDDDAVGKITEKTRSALVHAAATKESVQAAKRVARQLGTQEIIGTQAAARKGVMDDLISQVKNGDIYRGKDSARLNKTLHVSKMSDKDDMLGSSQTVFIE